MCGIAGIVSSKLPTGVDRLLAEMGMAIRHRGPDSSGIWFDEKYCTGFVHQRLAIQDLSPAGHQPMRSSSDRFVIVFNGEIYNFKELSRELSLLGSTFNGHSDTEVILESFEKWGVENSIKKFYGMFAIAVLDKDQSLLYLIRDRLGEKPLYYYSHNDVFMFASETHSFRAFPEFNNEIDMAAVASLVRHNCISSPRSIYKYVRKLTPGHYLKIQLGVDLKSVEQYHSVPFWELRFERNRSKSFVELSQSLETLLKHVIKDQMISDAPLGAFLSGGIDSSTVVALMQSQSMNKVKTFSIGFNEEEFNEAEHAAEVAKHLGTDHHELYVTAEDALNLVDKLATIYDEPFADPSQIPTLLLCEMARKQVTVSLSGDAGDELFCGYSRYMKLVNSWRRRGTLKSTFKKSIVQNLPSLTKQVLKRRDRYKNFSEDLLNNKIFREQKIGSSQNLSEYYQNVVSHWIDPEQAVPGYCDYEYGLNGPLIAGAAKDDYHTLMARDLEWYLRDDILVKVDRAAMHHSLETRVPMLDPRVVKFACTIPPELNLKNNIGKQLLRSVLYRYVPIEMVERPKTGFGIPIDAWLRGPLAEWASDLLNEKRLKIQGIFDDKLILEKWNAHRRGFGDFGFGLWGVLMFQAWYQKNYQRNA